jgi:hypothetical protein
VFRNVFSPNECQETRQAMWQIVENSSEGFDRNDPSTWSFYNSAGKYGLSMRGPCFHPVIVNNRQNPRLISALKTIIESEKVMVSHDRFTIYRATGSEIPNGETYRTGCKNIHLDLNPWWWCESSKAILDGLSSLTYHDQHDFIRENNLVVRSMGRHVQCVLNFEDNVTDDGGTIIIPGFHKYIDTWCQTVPVIQKKNKQQQNRKQKSTAQVAEIPFPPDPADCVPKDPLPWLHFPESNRLINYAQRVPMRAGSVLVWDQTIVHGTAPNNGTNRCRMAQFLKAFDGIVSISPERKILRAQALLNAFMENGISPDDLTADARTVFGLDPLREKVEGDTKKKEEDN